MFSETVILANGNFPDNQVPLRHLKLAKRIVCCDGAVRALVEAKYEPFAIVGDCDSIDNQFLSRFGDRIYKIDGQETNDLTKTVKWCIERGFTELTIIGATGKREDHTLGNISLLADYAKIAAVKMVTDFGIFYPVIKSETFESVKGQQVSIFSIDPETEISSEGLRYPLLKRKLKNWWEATLNEALGDSVRLEFKTGRVIVFLKYV